VRTRIVLAGGLNCAQSLEWARRGFERAGCDVLYRASQEHVGKKKPFRVAVEAEIMEALKGGADMLYWWQAQNGARLEFLKELKARFPHVHLVSQSIDDPYLLLKRAPECLSGFDVAATCCIASKKWYEDREVKPLVIMPVVDRDFHGVAVAGADYECDISFEATNVYPKEQYPGVIASRGEMVEAVRDLGGLNLYGPWDKKSYGWGTEYAGDIERNRASYRGWIHWTIEPYVYAASRINLSSHVVVGSEAYGYLNMRTVHATASGGFVLCDRVAGIEEWFEEDKEIVLWGSLAELREKARWWLAHDKERQRVAAAGRVRSLKQFDNQRAAEQILKVCGLR